MATAELPPPKSNSRPKAPAKLPADLEKNLVEAPAKEKSRTSGPINWYVTLWIGVIHLGALAAPFTFSWEGLGLLLVLHWLTGGIGICLGFHRLLTHTGFQTYPWFRYTLALIGGLAGEGSAIDWVANHRKHHAHSDQDDDPHSPHHGAWWSHMFWLAFMTHGKEKEAHYKRWAPDLAKDRTMWVIDSLFLPVQISFGLLMLGAGYLYGGWPMAASFVVWGVFLRLVTVLHATWFVNSASHMWGYKNYDSGDDSRNNWWVALITYGEGWHNNHHAYPRMARHGHRWWEIDVTYMAIRVMRAVGLVWDVVDYKQKKLGDDGSVKKAA